MTEISFEDLADGLRGWVRSRTAHERAAAELLIWYESWLRRPDFKDECITQLAPGLVARIDWYEAREFVGRGYARRGERPLPASSSQRAVLDLAVALGEDQFGLSGLGHAHKRAAAQAFAAAVGLRLEPPVPEVGHNHPDFIPGDPATCQRCAPEAGDEGRALPGGWKETGQ